MRTHGLTTVGIFCLGFCFGFYIDFMFLYLNFRLTFQEFRKNFTNETLNEMLSNNVTKFKEINNYSEKIAFDLQSTFAKEYLQGLLEVQSRKFSTDTSIFCLLRTEEYLHKGRSQHAAATWVQHCNNALFVSDAQDKTLPSIKVSEKSRWPKTLAGIKILHQNYSGQFNWTVILEDDTYVIIEHLREVLNASSYSPQSGIYFKFNMMDKPPERYEGRDIGYVLSAKAVEILATKSDSNITKECDENKNLESCCIAHNLTLGDLREPGGGYQIFPFDLRTGVNVSVEKDKDWWDWEHAFWPAPQPPYCCSTKPLTFHFVSPTMMYAFEFMIYHMTPASVHPISLPWSQIISNFDNIDFNTTNNTNITNP